MYNKAYCLYKLGCNEKALEELLQAMKIAKQSLLPQSHCDIFSLAVDQCQVSEYNLNYSI